MNALIQGSAARHTKLWMRACWREGIVPLLQMHDALDCSVASPEQAERVAQLGREAVKLEVPIQVDLKFGKTWGDATNTWEELQRKAPRPAAHPKRRNGGKVHLAAAPADPIQLPQTSVGETKMPQLSDLVGVPIREGKICCPFHADSTPSLHLYDDHFHCFGCGAHGDHIDWLMMIEGMDRDEAVRVLESWDARIARPRPALVDEEKKRLLALQLWHEARPITGTLAARYLSERRRIDVAALPDGDAALRFHPSCPFGAGIRKPCLIALLRDVVTDEAIGIHRIALTPDANRIERRMLGGAGAVKLWPAGSQLIVGEGIETVLAAATRISHHGAPLRPAWSALSSGSLGKLPIVPGVERLLILVDHDVNGEGQRAAARCAERWGRAGRDVI
jgi:hypothetical protein